MHIEEGLLPEWLIFHSLVEAGRITLRKVCAVEHAWVAPALHRLQQLDTAQLARSGTGGGGNVATGAGTGAGAADAGASRQGGAGKPQADQGQISAARERALARRAAGSIAKRKKVA